MEEERKPYVLVSGVWKVEDPEVGNKVVRAKVNAKIKEILDSKKEDEICLTMDDLMDSFLETFTWVNLNKKREKSWEQKFLDMVFAKTEELQEKRKALKERLIENGWEKYEYTDWTIIKKGKMEFTIRDSDFDIACGIFRSRCDYGSVQILDDKRKIKIGDICCSLDAEDCEVNPFPGDKELSKKNLRAWMKSIKEEKKADGASEEELKLFDEFSGMLEEDFCLLEE